MTTAPLKTWAQTRQLGTIGMTTTPLKTWA